MTCSRKSLCTTTISMQQRKTKTRPKSANKVKKKSHEWIKLRDKNNDFTATATTMLEMRTRHREADVSYHAAISPCRWGLSMHTDVLLTHFKQEQFTNVVRMAGWTVAQYNSSFTNITRSFCCQYKQFFSRSVFVVALQSVCWHGWQFLDPLCEVYITGCV